MTAIGPTFFPSLGAEIPSATISPQGWDRAVLADQVMPGLSRITRGGIRLKIDHKKKAGADGANPTFHGIDPQPLELEVRTFTDQDRESLATIARTLIPQAGKGGKPVSIDHPSLRVLGITSVMIVGASAIIVEEPGRAKMSFELLHWLPTKNKDATATPKAAPTRKINNDRIPANPPPTQQANFSAPPEFLQSGG